MISVFEGIDSIALFGSMARGDYDLLSDRDILLVSDSPHSLSHCTHILKKYDWSCTGYSWEQMMQFSTVGALFLQHLKQEASVFKDKDHRLTDSLNRFSPRCDYSHELEEATELLGLLAFIPNSEIGKFWAVDILLVGFRCLAIAALANEGRYHFSMIAILSALCDMGIFTNEDMYSLLELRRHKRAYRNRRFNERLEWNDVFRLIDIVDRGFRIGINAARCTPSIVMEAALAETPQENHGWYYISRKVEAALLCTNQKSQADTKEINEKRQSLLNKIIAPSENSSYFKYGYDEIRQTLVELTNKAIA